MNQEIAENTKEVQVKNNNSLQTVDDNFDNLINKISETTNTEELEELYQQFNINNTKKNVIRVSQLNRLLDKVNAEAEERITKRPDQISNKEMLDYMNAISNQIDRSQKIVDNIKDITNVQVNNTQNTVNINMNNENSIPTLNRESRDKITNLITEILKENKKDVIDIDTTNNKGETH